MVQGIDTAGKEALGRRFSSLVIHRGYDMAANQSTPWRETSEAHGAIKKSSVNAIFSQEYGAESKRDILRADGSLILWSCLASAADCNAVLEALVKTNTRMTSQTGSLALRRLAVSWAGVH
jgi:hypothetical protein